MSRFDDVINRRNTNSEKYDFAEQFRGDENAVPLWVADMDFRAPEAVVEAVTKKAEHGIWGYSEAKEDYYDAVMSWFEKRHGWKTKREWILKTPGVIYAINAAVKAFTEPGEAVLIQRPVYPPFAACIEENGRKLINNELVYNNGRYEMNLEEMEQLICRENVKLFILCNPHNPVGRVWTKQELEQAGRLCLKHGVFVVSDEIHCDFTHPGHVHTPFASISEELSDNCAVCTAPSKTFNLAGVQVSNIFVSNPNKKALLMKQLKLSGYGELNIFALTACRAAYESGAPWLDELKAYLADNLAYIRGFMQERLPQIHLNDPEGTYLLWIDFSGLSLEPEELRSFLLHKAGIWLSDGRDFADVSGQFMRLNMACPRSLLERAMEQLADAVKAL